MYQCKCFPVVPTSRYSGVLIRRWRCKMYAQPLIYKSHPSYHSLVAFALSLANVNTLYPKSAVGTPCIVKFLTVALSDVKTLSECLSCIFRSSYRRPQVCKMLRLINDFRKPSFESLHRRISWRTPARWKGKSCLGHHGG